MARPSELIARAAGRRADPPPAQTERPQIVKRNISPDTVYKQLMRDHDRMTQRHIPDR